MMWTRVAVIGVAVLMGFPARAQTPLARPNPPKAEVKGAPGRRTVGYWAYAQDARGHSRYSDTVMVTNAPDTYSEKNFVVLTPSPVEGATSYRIITCRADAPRDAKVEVGAKGNKTFYYWFQVRNGRTVMSSVSGPIKVEGCADKPENKLTWSPTGAEFYSLYRTETPTPPVGWRNCVILAGKPAKDEPTWSDKGLVVASRIINPAGSGLQKPEGNGRYLVGTSKGEPVTDRGQELQVVTAYDMNTTDPAFRAFKPEIKGYEPGGDSGVFQFDFENRTVGPKLKWEHFNSLAIHQKNIAGGLNEWHHESGVHLQAGKNTYNGIDIQQMNYTAAQHSPYMGYMYNYGVGDNILLHSAINQEGQNRDAGDEGTEFFSLHTTRTLKTEKAAVGADARTGDIYLRIEGRLGQTAAGRGIVNLTQAYREGSAHVEQGAIAVGNGVQWKPEMEGWFISFDADTTELSAGPTRQWYRVREVLSPTKLRLFGYTYFSVCLYKGKATKDGPYLLCPYTEMADGDALTNQGMRVIPLQSAWKKGDQIETVAGPHTTVRLGWWEVQGEFLPQDHVAGLGIMYGGKKPTDEGALMTYNWAAGIQVHNSDAGMVLYDGTRIGMKAFKETPVLIACVRDDPFRFELSQDANGFVVNQTQGARWLGLGAKGLTLYGKTTIKGNERTRGLNKFSGDGKTVQFHVKFADPCEAAPFVVASSSLPIGMGVTEIGKEGFTVTFAQPPAAGQNNVEITWMMQE
jgi:hypothetical protein